MLQLNKQQSYKTYILNHLVKLAVSYNKSPKYRLPYSGTWLDLMESVYYNTELLLTNQAESTKIDL